MRKTYAVWILVGLVVLAGACAGKQRIKGEPVTGLDRKLSTFAFIEEGDLVTFVVGTKAARYRDGTAFMPVEIALANTGVKALLVTREAFTLVDEQGNRYPAAAPDELIKGYEFLDLDRESFSELPSILTSKFAAYQRYPSKLSPTHQLFSDVAGVSTVVRDNVSLPKFGYFMDYVYFPKPATGIKGHKFDLFLKSSTLPDPVFVKFAVE
jgi:hypothetical protein